MRALEFIRGHVTLKLPYDFSYQMKTPHYGDHYFGNFICKKKWALFFLKWGTNWTQLFLHLAPISGSYSSDFAYQLYPSLIMKKLKIKFVQKELVNFF